MLMFNVNMHVTSVLFLIWFNNFAPTMGVTRSYSSRPFFYVFLVDLNIFSIVLRLLCEEEEREPGTHCSHIR